MGRMGKAARQDAWNINIKVNPTQVRDLLGHPVMAVIKTFMRTSAITHAQVRRMFGSRTLLTNRFSDFLNKLISWVFHTKPRFGRKIGHNQDFILDKIKNCAFFCQTSVGQITKQLCFDAGSAPLHPSNLLLKYSRSNSCKRHLS